MGVPHDRQVTLNPVEAAALATLAPHGGFSCAPNCSVWPERTKGWHAPHERMDIQGTFNGLDRAVRLFLRSWPEGGGFRLETGAFVRADGDLVFALWQLAA